MLRIKGIFLPLFHTNTFPSDICCSAMYSFYYKACSCFYYKLVVVSQFSLNMRVKLDFFWSGKGLNPRSS